MQRLPGARIWKTPPGYHFASENEGMPTRVLNRGTIQSKLMCVCVCVVVGGVDAWARGCKGGRVKGGKTNR